MYIYMGYTISKMGDEAVNIEVELRLTATACVATRSAWNAMEEWQSYIGPQSKHIILQDMEHQVDYLFCISFFAAAVLVYASQLKGALWSGAGHSDGFRGPTVSVTCNFFFRLIRTYKIL